MSEMFAEMTLDDRAARQRERVQRAKDELDGVRAIDPGEGANACHQRVLEGLARHIQAMDVSLRAPDEVRDMCAAFIRLSAPA